ncbi:PIN domain-containing protein [Tuberibacillus sp. Marseille-P3662]|uniref:PIN domain-containing protein n=1 Tax=Tuberibacillus sp. Marseille-P3662 TaxID=1965358 RepID=UPI000A1CD74C|nr:PIN domain-containing protein [Tuberibacillus sp. Marseille-P3662]
MKQKLAIDTNIIIRLLTGDPNKLFKQAEQLVQEVEKGVLSFYVPSMIVAESCWVLESYYKVSKREIADTLIEFLQSDGVEVEEPWIINALNDFADNNVDFIDAYLAKKAQGSGLNVITWNEKDFRRLKCEFYTPNNLLGSKK